MLVGIDQLKEGIDGLVEGIDQLVEPIYEENLEVERRSVGFMVREKPDMGTSKLPVQSYKIFSTLSRVFVISFVLCSFMRNFANCK